MMGNGVRAQHSQPFRNPLFLITYLPPKTAGLVYSDKLGVYTNDLARAESLPPPHSPPTRKCEIFERELFKEVDERTDKFLDTDINGPINEFVQQLTGCYDDDMSKVRALYRWCTSQPIMVTHYDNSSFQTMAYQLWNLQQGRTSYAFLFHMLCCLSGIPCVIINGFIKGASYTIGQRMSRDKHIGEWNAVLIGEHWRLIDTFWGASVVPGETDDSAQSSSYVSEENYFLPDPEQYIYAHFPLLSEWQLLGEDQKTLHDFETMAVLNDRFFDFKMELMSHFSSTIETETAEVKVKFGLDPRDSLNQTFFCVPSIIKDKSSSEDQGDLSNNNAWLTVNDTTKGRELEVNARFPGPGMYRLDIVGKDKTNKSSGYNYDWVAVYRVIVKPKTVTKTLVDSPSKLDSVSVEPCKRFPEFGLAAFEHPGDVTEMAPGILQLRYQISDAEKLGNASVSVALVRLIDDGKALSRYSNDPVNVVPFVKEGNELAVELEISEGRFGIRFIYGNSTGKGALLCSHKIVCVPSPKQHVKEAKLLDTSVGQAAVSSICKDQHYTAIQTAGNITQLTPVERTECEQKYTLSGKKPVENTEKQTRAIDENVKLEPGRKNHKTKSKIKTVAASQAILDHIVLPTPTENIAAVHSIKENTSSTKVQPETTVIDVRMPTDSAEIIFEDMRSEASHIPELRQCNDEETVKTESKYSETEGSLLVVTTKENTEPPKCKSKVKRLKRKSERNQNGKEQLKHKSGLFQDENSRLKSKMNQDRNINLPNKKEEKPVNAKRVVVKPKKKRKEKAVPKPHNTDELATADIPVHITQPEYKTTTDTISEMQQVNTEEGEQEPDNVDIEELRKELVAAIENQHIGELYSVVKEAATSGHVTRLDPEFTEARETLLKLRRVLKVTQKVMGLNQRALSEIRSYVHPIPEIHRVMQAALLLMGHGEHEIREWNDIRLVIGKSGKSSIQRQIRRLRVGDIGPGVIERSRRLLQGLNQDDLGRYSVGVAALYSWAVEVSEGTHHKRFRKTRK